jgi:class 3 adenylate cyclase/tetratricopeptide (TPR) repeat protein
MTAERREAVSDLASDLQDAATVFQQTTELKPEVAGGKPAVAAPPRAAGDLPVAFGRYQVRRALGAGGFGAVYLGHDTQLDRPVAIKVLRAQPSQLEAENDRALQEARRLARLRHPAIVAVHDVGVDGGRLYIVSDYLEGPDLSVWLRDNRSIWPDAVRIAAAIADGLSHAHAQLIVHRDVKPANILFTAERTPVLVDFGLALDESLAGGKEKGVITGTPWYMSPEQVSGAAHRIDGRTDIYSLGVVLYEMLTGRVPFRAAEAVELLRQVREDEPQPPRQLVRDIPPELERACLKALAKRQQDRYTTAADFAADLRRVLPTAESSGSWQLPVATPPSERAMQTPASHWPGTLAPPSSRSRIREAERRQVTVLVGGWDLFETEEYLGLDTEEQSQVLRAIQQACEQEVRSFDGTIVQCNEQGLQACFGYPVAHEDAARCAARAGLGLLDNLKILGGQLLAGHHLDANPWLGIHTGPAIVEVKDDVVSLVGEARNVAVRLQDIGARGRVVCTEATHRLIRIHFRSTSLGPRKLKGIGQAPEIYHVQGVNEVQSALEATPTAALTPLTGRDHEMSLLRDRWEQAQEGMGQVVLLIGEPGLGKSRLVHTLKEQVLGQMTEGAMDAPVIEWRCSPHYQNTGLYPAIDFYERALGFGREEPPKARLDRLLQRLELYDLARPETVPLWTALLSLPTPDHYPSLTLSPARQREETFRTMLEWLRRRAARGPILFVVEDLHWVDASTLEFLGQFLAEGLHDSILTVLTFRPEFRTPWPAVAHQTSLALTRLTRRQVRELMRKKAGEALPEAVVEQVYERAGGVPLFVEEFTRMVQESGVLEEPEEGNSRRQMLLKREIPTTLQDLVMARLDRLESEREVAQLAATLGREFHFELLAAVAAVGEEALQTELAKLVQAEILFAKGRPPQCIYMFKHALLEEALYNTLVKGKRQQFHKHIGEVLEARFPQTTDTQPELLAHHFTEAGLTEKAIQYWFKAGQRSRERSALCEAIGHLTTGLGLVRTLAETPERDDRELQFLITLAPTYITARGYAAPEVESSLLRASELCRRMEAQQQLFGIMLGMWEWRIVRADLRRCVDLAAEGMSLAERLNDPGITMEALFMPGVTMFYRGEFAGARACHEKALAYDNREHTKFWTAYTGHNAGVTHRCYLALTLWHLGYPDQALQMSHAACNLARAIGHAFSLGHAVDFWAYLGNCCRLGTEVQTAAEEEIAIATEQGFQLWQALGTLHKGVGMLLQGQREEGLPLLLKGYRAFRATGAEVRVPTYLGLLGDAYTKAGRFEEARLALKEGLAVAEKNDDRSHESELHRLHGELLLAESPDKIGAAKDCFAQAIETARRQGSKAWELRATMSLARLGQRQGRSYEARTKLAAVLDTFTEGHTTPDLVDAAALLHSQG